MNRGLRLALTSGAAHLLEDGLLLATLAQVHLLNNVGRLQKPDILFFNSFLIAIVTSFLSVDVGYSIVFLASDRSSRTTGCILTVDGGLREAFPR